MDKISSALVKAQQGFAPALKSSTNPHFKSRYADLAACVEAVIDSLNTNGIALIQRCHDCEDGVKVETVFVHESGESLSGGVLHVPAAKSDPQGYGSALTYARRYALMAACGIAPEDDDGNSAKAAPNRTKVMKVTNSIKDHLANSRELGAYQEWEAVRDDTDFAKAVWSGLATPERDKLRELSNQAQKEHA